MSDYAENDRMLAERFWGYRPEKWTDLDATWRAPLPEAIWGRNTYRTPKDREPQGVEGLAVPPYVLAMARGQNVEIMLCTGGGVRATTSGECCPDTDETPDAEFVYADGKNVPEEWHEPIANALAKVRDLWPDKTIRLRPLRTAHMDNS